MTLAMPPSRSAALLSDPTFRARVARVVRKRVADDQAVEDIIQEAFTDAYAYESRLPKEDGAAKKYLFGIVRNKIRMHIRQWMERTHEAFDEEIHGRVRPPPVEARFLLRKIVADVPPSRWGTFTWFVRVTFGESLAEIARDAQVDYNTAYKRHARMRSDLRRSARRVTSAVAAVLLAAGIVPAMLAPPPFPDLAPAPPQVVYAEPTAAEETAAELRRAAFAACDARRWAKCVEKFDEARRSDPAGDIAEDVQAARRAARVGLAGMHVLDR